MATKESAMQAAAGSFQKTVQQIYDVLQKEIWTTNSDAEKQSAMDRATKGIESAKDVSERMEKIINSVFSK